MAAALTLLLIGSLLQGSQSKEFKAFMPQTIEVLTGSCVTIPCSFEIKDEFESKLDDTCGAKWSKDNNLVFNSKDPQTPSNKGELTGNLRKKDCTTTLNNIQPAGSYRYYFRLECNNDLKCSFVAQTALLSVKDDPPRPTLTPSALKVEEGASVSLKCSAPAPCLSHPPNVTWTKGLGDIVETLQENEDRTKVLTSVVTFTASHKHHGETISCKASYHKQDGSAESAVSLKADVSYAPQILPSSDCIRAGDQLNCSCGTLGNPPPTVRWYVNGAPVNHSKELLMSSTTRWSIITLNKQQEAGLSSLLCRSMNSVGSATQRFCVNRPEAPTNAESQADCTGRFTLPFIATVVALTAALLCALLFAIRAHRTRCPNSGRSEYTGDTSTAVTSQGLAGEKLIEVTSVTAEEAIYANTNMTPHVPNSGAGHQQVACRRPEEKPNEDGSDVLYSSVTFKSHSKMKQGERSGGQNPSSCSYLEEERCREGGTARDYVVNAWELTSLYDKIGIGKVDTKKINTEYAQVHL
ncbi:uncharacterized protein ACO6RY_12664 [Pungitius sinensis]